jgi:hypothetical protein
MLELRRKHFHTFSSAKHKYGTQNLFVAVTIAAYVFTFLVNAWVGIRNSYIVQRRANSNATSSVETQQHVPLLQSRRVFLYAHYGISHEETLRWTNKAVTNTILMRTIHRNAEIRSACVERLHHIDVTTWGVEMVSGGGGLEHSSAFTACSTCRKCAHTVMILERSLRYCF